MAETCKQTNNITENFDDRIDRAFDALNERMIHSKDGFIHYSDLKAALMAMKSKKQECDHQWGIKSVRMSTKKEECFSEHVCFKCQRVITVRQREHK